MFPCRQSREEAVDLSRQYINGKPNYDSMAEAVDAVIADKFGKDGIYTDEALFDRIYKGDFGAKYLTESSDYPADVIVCTRDICTYIYETHRSFPAHAEEIHVPGVWLQTLADTWRCSPRPTGR